MAKIKLWAVLSMLPGSGDLDDVAINVFKSRRDADKCANRVAEATDEVVVEPYEVEVWGSYAAWNKEFTEFLQRPE